MGTAFGLQDCRIRIKLKAKMLEESWRNVLPTTAFPRERLEIGMKPTELFVAVGLVSSRREVKRLIKQGGLYADGLRIDNIEWNLSIKNIPLSGAILRVGKKKIHRVVVEQS